MFADYGEVSVKWLLTGKEDQEVDQEPPQEQASFIADDKSLGDPRILATKGSSFSRRCRYSSTFVV